MIVVFEMVYMLDINVEGKLCFAWKFFMIYGGFLITNDKRSEHCYHAL